MDDTDPAADSSAARPAASLLEEKRAELLTRIEQFGASNPAETSNLNFGKRIGDGTTYAVERMTGAYQARTLYETVKEIDQALERLDDGLIRSLRVMRPADPRRAAARLAVGGAVRAVQWPRRAGAAAGPLARLRVRPAPPGDLAQVPGGVAGAGAVASGAASRLGTASIAAMAPFQSAASSTWPSAVEASTRPL